jgi:hypothetical protein
VLEFANEELNWATRLLLKWLLESDPPAVDALIQKAYETVDRDLSLIDGRDICAALQDHLAASVREIIRYLISGSGGARAAARGDCRTNGAFG